MGATTTVILFWAKTGMGSGGIVGLGCVCPALMWECWDHWGRTLGGGTLPHSSARLSQSSQ